VVLLSSAMSALPSILPVHKTRSRRQVAIPQAAIARALRAVKQAGGECVVRINPDGSVTIGGTALQTAPVAPNNEFARGLGIVP
jgi:hypothetical protein